jgi:branched-chain amino acid transport system ATP-binding protein
VNHAALTIRNVVVQFGGVRVLDDINLDVQPGEIRGLIGPNGSGKTTLFNVVSGTHTPKSGEVLLFGTPTTGWKPSEIASRGLGRTFQTSRLFRGMTVLENLMAGLHRRTRSGILSAGLRLSKATAEEEETERAARQSLEFVGMLRFADRRSAELSFGQQRVVEIARTLISEPKIVLLDEPAVGLSVNRLAEFDRLLRRVRDEKGITLLMIEHVIRLVMDICDKVSVLSSGRIIADGNPEAVRNDKNVIEAYLGKELRARYSAP